MPTIPQQVTLTNSSVDVLNAIRNSASVDYRNYVPIATPDADSVRAIGAILMDNVALRNEFVTAIINRIGRVLVTSKLYDNPWAMFKKGILEFGETTEEIFVELAKPFQYDPEEASAKFAKRELPDVRSAFHVLNYKKFYKDTIQNNSLKTAFLSWEGVTDLISKIVEKMYTSANYDEFMVMKYMIAKKIIDGQMTVNGVAAIADENMKSIVSTIKGISNDMTFMKDKYNIAGVKTHTAKNDQFVIINSKFEAQMNVEVLAAAFNMDKAQFAGQMVLVDSFGSIDNERLAVLFANDPNYVELTQAQLEALDAIPCVLVDRDWFMVYDNLIQMDEMYIGEGMYWQYWLHTWKTFSVSPFANAVVFIPATPSVTSVSVSPNNIDVPPVMPSPITYQITPTVVTSNFAPKTVSFTVDPDYDDNGITVSNTGLVTVPAGNREPDTLGEIVVTSTFDPSKTARVMISVAEE